jgi:hypothetical protein
MARGAAMAGESHMTVSWPGLSRSPTNFVWIRLKDVGGRPEPVLGRALGATRGPAMTQVLASLTGPYAIILATMGACLPHRRKSRQTARVTARADPGGFA